MYNILPMKYIIYILLLVPFILKAQVPDNDPKNFTNATIKMTGLGATTGTGVEIADSVVYINNGLLTKGKATQTADTSHWDKIGVELNYTQGNVGIGITDPISALDIRSTEGSLNIITTRPDGSITSFIERDTTPVGNILKGLYSKHTETLDGVFLRGVSGVGIGNIGGRIIMEASMGVTDSLVTWSNLFSASDTSILILHTSIDSVIMQFEMGGNLQSLGLEGVGFSYQPNKFSSIAHYAVATDVAGGSFLLGSGVFAGEGTNLFMTPVSWSIGNEQSGVTTSIASGDPDNGILVTGTDTDPSNQAFRVNSSAGNILTISNNGQMSLEGSINITGNIVPQDTIYQLGAVGMFWNDIHVKIITASEFNSRIGSGLSPFEIIHANTITAYTSILGDSLSGGSLLLQSNPSNDGDIVLGGTVGMQLTFEESSGRVGIGTTASPSTRLHVDNNAANTEAILTLENTAGNIQIFRVDATPEGSITGSIGDLAIDGTNGNIYIKESGSATNTGWVTLK